MRRFLFRTVSQIGVQYRHSPLSEGAAGSVRGGDRLPWVETGANEDNFAPLASLDWQVHVYGEPRPRAGGRLRQAGTADPRVRLERKDEHGGRCPWCAATWFGRMDTSRWPIALAKRRPWPAISPHTICAAPCARHARASLSETYAGQNPLGQ